MTETALAIRKPSVVDIDLGKLNTRQMRFLAKQRDKERIYETVRGTAGGAKDIFVELMRAVKDDETARGVVLALFVLGLHKAKFLTTTEAGILEGVVLGGTLASLINPFD